MIVCVCNNVSESKIRQAVEQGTSSLRELRTNLEVGSCCGKCMVCARQVLRDCQQQLSALQSAPAHRIHPIQFQSFNMAA
ncbi:regulatory or redox protein complexing with Bfr, in iron storage and mobility [Undibacterium piscinae]|jgi:bacterioferritin-associated ferredoxin|uniref:Bacterioferritin-associated ferredoxin n=1 Tax=Undibacterium piscinae TaxID=2495591 RepID=A0A6M4A8Y4_9BURK|nr:regulatory or redox protein complexing with Bfr, in iron storage and mobility [Undibacterium piscinae]